ncbi:hypothetical protein WA026_003961 [Henosepilachna vigintioctopunctata]|uniref:Uncharacterized protein n=1 Tax=Henosepilachna vigintioctopunctata TaxID=420089 RepID=A0AAW1UDA9_9CUCU
MLACCMLIPIRADAGVGVMEETSKLLYESSAAMASGGEREVSPFPSRLAWIRSGSLNLRPVILQEKSTDISLSVVNNVLMTPIIGFSTATIQRWAYQLHNADTKKQLATTTCLFFDTSSIWCKQVYVSS